MVLETLPIIEPLYLADVTLPPSHPQAGASLPVFAFLVRHPDGPFLVDTGVGAGHDGIEQLYRPQRRPLAQALEESGVAPANVVAVVNTHLHFDHCGENRLFPGTRIYVRASEYEAAQQALYTVAEWVDFPEATFEFVEDEPEILPGVFLLPTPGHTPGHQSLLIESKEGRAVIAGQAAYKAEEFGGADCADPLPQWDGAQYAGSLRRLRELDPKRVYLSHDVRVWEAETTGLPLETKEAR